MKKTFLLIMAFAFMFVGTHAQSSQVEAVSQLSKAEQFKLKNSFIKETEIYKAKGAFTSTLRVSAKIFTDLKSKEEVAALEFYPSKAVKVFASLAGVNPNEILPLGYLDMDRIDDLLLALETILSECKNSNKKDNFTISYSAPGGIDVSYTTLGDIVLFRKKWYAVDDYGTQTSKYSEGAASCRSADLPQVIESIKEAKAIANQALAK